MSVGINQVILIGHLGRDPEIREVTGGAVCELSLATNEKWRDAKGEDREHTEWHRVVVWNRLAENCAQYLRKGDPCYVEGKLQTASWVDDRGVKRYRTKVLARRVVFLRKSDRQPVDRSGDSNRNPDRGDQSDDIPF